MKINAQLLFRGDIYHVGFYRNNVTSTRVVIIIKEVSKSRNFSSQYS